MNTLLDTMGAILPGAVALASFAPFTGAAAAFVAAALTVGTYYMVFRDNRATRVNRWPYFNETPRSQDES
jgi:hypothetical protein